MSRTRLRVADERARGADDAASAAEVAIIIPCYNEEKTVARVVESFRAELPNARVYVFDNNSTDRTIEEARRAGAEVFREPRRGKGYVVQSMFRTVDADFYVMVDGDDTYPADAVHRLLAPVAAGDADMAVGSRLHAESRSQFKQLNRAGNRLVRATLNFIFRVRLSDILSGYRAFNRRFVKELPLFGGGFEIETELTIKAVGRGFRLVEIPVDLVPRPDGSHSKIRFMRDGFLILNTTLALFRDYKPLTFFGATGLFLALLALAPGALAAFGVAGWSATVRVALALLALALFLCGLLSVTAGLILHSIARRSQEFEYHMGVLADELRAGRGARDERGGEEGANL
ncbi:MAG TPA: glycosyltransferase [Pyrinomonadaceae bacterium]|jgi:glycosyltransferase involved in cell wall biosynthesis|nr:glycosyltransferase [Pyrinomonadaceae bacterium]